MSEYVQITLIICSTIIVCNIISCFKENNDIRESPRERYGGYQPKITKVDNNELTKMRKPPSTGSGIGHNPSPIGEKPGFPGRKSTDTLEFSQEDE